METESETPTVVDTFETADTEIVVEGPDVQETKPIDFEVIAEEHEPREPVDPPFKGIQVHAKIVVNKEGYCVDHFVRNSNLSFLNKTNNEYLVSLGVPAEQADVCHTMMHYCANMFEVARQLGGTVEGIHFTSH